MQNAMHRNLTVTSWLSYQVCVHKGSIQHLVLKRESFDRYGCFQKYGYTEIMNFSRGF